MSEEAAPSRFKAKKLPFKPTALRRSAPRSFDTPSDDGKAVENDGLDLFRRSKEMEPIMAADRDRRLRKKQKQEEERRKAAESAKRRLDVDVEADTDADTNAEYSQLARSSTPVAGPSRNGDKSTSELVTPPSSKRTRLNSTPAQNASLDVDNLDLALDDSPSARRLRSHKPATPGSIHHQVTTTAKAGPIVLLDSDSDEDVVQVASTSRGRRSDSVEVVGTGLPASNDEDDDDFGAEYVRMAQEQRARDQALLGAGPDGSSTKRFTEILVTSEVPGAKACRIKFPYDKELSIARNGWLSSQPRESIFTELDREDVVLTWRRRKVFITDTLLCLGIRPQANGRIVVDGNNSEGLADGRTRVHMEAWTLDLFEKMEREEEQRRRRKVGDLSDEGDEPAPPEEEPPAQQTKLRVILKARDLEDVGLSVLPETTVETLITGFRAQRSIESNKDVGIWFDGDRLEEHVTMDEAGIDDMDTFEVHIK